MLLRKRIAFTGAILKPGSHQELLDTAASGVLFSPIPSFINQGTSRQKLIPARGKSYCFESLGTFLKK
jgi:hypothetical protein